MNIKRFIVCETKAMNNLIPMFDEADICFFF